MNIKFSQLDVAALLNQPLLPQCLAAMFGVLWLFVLGSGIRGMIDKPQPIILSSAMPQGLPANLQQSLAMPLFGAYHPPQNASSPLRQSLLNLEVIGIMYDAGDPLQSHALIRADNGSVRPYQVNDTIPGGAVIKRIQANRVVIEFHGELEGLFLKKQTLHFEPPPKPLIDD